MTESTQQTISVDLSEKGMLKGQPISLDRRLFMKFTAFNGCESEQDAALALAGAGVEGALYVERQRPHEVSVSWR